MFFFIYGTNKHNGSEMYIELYRIYRIVVGLFTILAAQSTTTAGQLTRGSLKLISRGRRRRDSTRQLRRVGGVCRE